MYDDEQPFPAMISPLLVYLSLLYQTALQETIIPTLQMRKMRYRKGAWPDQDPVAFTEIGMEGLKIQAIV